MVLEEWLPSEVLDGMVVPIAEVQWEVVAVEQAAHHHLLICPLLRMVCSRLEMSRVVGIL